LHVEEDEDIVDITVAKEVEKAMDDGKIEVIDVGTGTSPRNEAQSPEDVAMAVDDTHTTHSPTDVTERVANLQKKMANAKNFDKIIISVNVDNTTDLPSSKRQAAPELNKGVLTVGARTTNNFGRFKNNSPNTALLKKQDSQPTQIVERRSSA